MLAALQLDSMEVLLERVVPAGIRARSPLSLPPPLGEHAALEELRSLALHNRVHRSFLGQGYHGCVTPPVIQRNILENPAWYTAYTPYQAEIAQGRLEALANFQTLIADLTGLPFANASLLDEGTAAAEALAMAHAAADSDSATRVFVDANCHPQTLAVLRTRAEALHWELEEGDADAGIPETGYFAAVVQTPDTRGRLRDIRALADAAHRAGALLVTVCDPLALTLREAPGLQGADIAVGSTQRFGVPMGFGGPHAAYIATRDALKRLLPGRLVGLSRDAQGRPAYRLALQTREQHIRRDKATSNICTAQVLLAVMASMYAVYHGPEGLVAIALRTHRLARVLQKGLTQLGLEVSQHPFFDTVFVPMPPELRDAWIHRARLNGMLLRGMPEGVCMNVDETTSLAEVETLLACAVPGKKPDVPALAREIEAAPADIHNRETPFLTHPVFHSHHSETQMLRYIRHLESQDFSLVHSMIPLGSCTMKLNATSEMLPVSWPEFSQIHPFAPESDTEGYARVCAQLRTWLGEITGFPGISLQPNAGSQGEYAGLLVIRAFHRARGQAERDVCLIPASAHGTNPASAVMAGLRVISVRCGANGDVDLEDLRRKAAEHRDRLAALMVTYPSTHGVFEEGIREICACIHEAGGQVYMDGANLNAQVGVCRVADLGVDVCHLNLHKTFCIPHGGGGPGVGPIAVAEHLAPFLPTEKPEGAPDGSHVGPVCSAPQGSAGILAIPWMYIRMMGAGGLRRATERAILHANYIAHRLDPFFPVLYRGRGGWVAHECILDLRAFKLTTAEDVAKRLIDFGFHAPTLSWPVAGTLMVEPTESESLEELDRFCEAMIAIHGEMTAVEEQKMDPYNNPLKNAPHPASVVCADIWDRPYTRAQAAYPAPWSRSRKLWPSVGRIDNVWGDRNLFCACAPVEPSGADSSK
jgi:glycine dehydrogenase